MTLRIRRRTLGALGLAVLLGLIGWGLSSGPCLTTWVRSGVALDHCPDGRLRVTYQVEAEQLRRGATGSIAVTGWAHYTTDGREWVYTEPHGNFEATLELVDSAGKAHPLPLAKDGEWTRHGRSQRAQVAVPVLPDGEYLLRARLSSRLSQETLDTPLQFFSPARVHVLTDRPLYEPGQQVKFRSVVLKAKDLSPLEGRPGTWTVIDPSGEVVLEERGAAGPWGVSSGSFPLDLGAPTGAWRVRWSSGDASDEASVRVEPFTVPRFRVEAAPLRSFYGPGGQPVVKGAVTYASGAPVAGAQLRLDWQLSGPWPQPTGWTAKVLPQVATAGRDGRFTLELPPLPYDLRGLNTLSATVSATDAAGDQVTGGVAVLLSEDPILVDTVTELGDGLVQGYNNRLYLRATTADGTPLAGASLKVTRAWDPLDPGVEALADEDGVAALQLDPGVPVNVLVPPMPYRPPPPEPAISLQGVSELIGGEVALADQMALEQAQASFERCATWTLEARSVSLAVRIGRSGAVSAVASGGSRLEACLREAAQGRRFPAGRDRLLVVELAVTPAPGPWLAARLEGSPGVPGELEPRLADALLGARACLPDESTHAVLPRSLEWRTRGGSPEVRLSWVSTPQGERLPTGVQDCIEAKVPSRLVLSNPQAEGLGVAALSVYSGAAQARAYRPQATTFLGYEFKVVATLEGRALGSAKLRMRPGTLPPLRLRPSTVVAAPGETVELQLLRGKDYTAALPEKVLLTGGEKPVELEVKEKKARYQVPADAQGWLQFEAASARALVFVRSGSELTLALTPDQERYRPGALAHLRLETRVAGKPGPAAVGLFGVDETLGQLAPLEGAESLARVRPRVSMSAPAFGSLQAQALMQGRIRGAHAAAATVLRVTGLPDTAADERPASARSATTLDANGELTEAFYNVLSELHGQARRWEGTAAKGEQASPATVARLWSSALEACEARGERITDAFGRPVRLSLLPEDLLALTDPRAVIVDGTRLPEDVENWNQWVAEEQP